MRVPSDREETSISVTCSVADETVPLPVTSSWPPLLRGAFFCILISIPGSLMGIPFPAGIKLLGQVEPGLIPWAWTVNGVFSVLAPLLAEVREPETPKYERKPA